jgi:glycosyltransferase involved in cell wall biosynthesis
VERSKLKRKLYDFTLRFECVFFKNVSVVSEGVKKRLYLRKDTVVIPLGANEINLEFTKREGISLIYIGTLSKRNIHQTIEGLALFLSECKSFPISYRIIGSGDIDSMSKIENALVFNELSDIVELTGYIPHDKLTDYLRDANVGVSYVPITEYYNFQPATKTFEYLLAGLPVIATSTYENEKIINSFNGILIKDNPASFCQGLLSLKNQMKSFDSNEIKLALQDFTWKKIVNNLDKYIFKNDYAD